MTAHVRHIAYAILTVALGAAGCRDASRAAPVNTTAGEAPAAPVASAIPADVLPANRVLDPQRFADPRTRAAYEAARKYASVLEHIYCYCRCKENIGHRALVECFETDHAEHCDSCQMEALTAARMTAEGRSPAEIQKAIDEYFAS